MSRLLFIGNFLKSRLLFIPRLLFHSAEPRFLERALLSKIDPDYFVLPDYFFIDCSCPYPVSIQLEKPKMSESHVSGKSRLLFIPETLDFRGAPASLRGTPRLLFNQTSFRERPVMVSPAAPPQPPAQRCPLGGRRCAGCLQ